MTFEVINFVWLIILYCVVKYEKLVLGDLQTNCYLVWNDKSKEAVVIDPADDGVEIAQEIQARQLELKGILLTHGHFDHAMGALDLKLISNVPIYAHSDDLFLLKRQQETARHFLKRKVVVPNIEKIDIDLKDVEEIKIGTDVLQVIKCPGHTPGGVSFYNETAGILFSGDTMFANGLRGSTNHIYSSTKKIFESLENLLKLPPKTTVLSGHGEETTIGTERKRYQLE
jgi:glyoxylase-like metal-dependent hydrolase (beta-lactamase superfamily II)